MTDNPLIRTCVNEIENRITLKIKTGYYLELLTLETIKLVRTTIRKITKYENGKNLPNLEINNVVLVHFNNVNNDYQHDSESSVHLFSTSSLVNYYIFCLKFLFLKKLLIQSFHILKYGLLIKILSS